MKTNQFVKMTTKGAFRSYLAGKHIVVCQRGDVVNSDAGTASMAPGKRTFVSFVAYAFNLVFDWCGTPATPRNRELGVDFYKMI